jgi:hypothetical protein
VGKAIIKLWNSGKIHADQYWNFAYENGQKLFGKQQISEMQKMASADRKQFCFGLIAESHCKSVNNTSILWNYVMFPDSFGFTFVR